MRLHLRLHGIGKPALVLSLTLIFAHSGSAQIYKWVDDEGNVHYGDKPQNSRDAAAAQEVEVQEAYTPSTTTDIDASLQQSEADLKKSQAIRRQEAQEKDEQERAAAAQRKSEKDARCARLVERYRQLNGYQIVNGRRTRYFLVDDEGKSLSAAEQERLLAEVRARGEAEGCTGFDAAT